MSKKTSRIIIFASAVIAITLFALFLKDILVPFIKLEIANDVDGAKELLRSRGILGFLTVALVEALQMVVVFIPAEFIQISSGLSYPFPLALLLCDLGVCLGATIIFILVRTFKIQNDAYDRRKKTIDKIAGAKQAKGDKNTILFMLLLFIMPLIPFGAICYYGSGTKIKYHKYILTVAGGVIPSIVTSNLMGSAARAFIQNSLPLWLLILIIVLLGALLLTTLLFFLNKYFLKESDGTPDSPVFSMLMKLSEIYLRGRLKLKVGKPFPEDVTGPFVLLANHQCFLDFYLVYKLGLPLRPAYVANEYYTRKGKFETKCSKKMGFIPKKLFTFDASTPIQIYRTLRKGYPVAIFPEARMSVDGTTNPLTEESAAFFRKMGYPVVLVTIKGAYFAKPKWRKKIFRSEVVVSAEKVIRQEDFAAYTDEELNALIRETLWNDASNDGLNTYRQKNKARGLENVLYRCIHCGKVYSTIGEGNALKCRNCGLQNHLNSRYLFDEEIDGRPGTISAYYSKIRDMEEAELDTLRLETLVDTKIFDKNMNLRLKEKGECELTKEGFSYRSGSVSFTVPAKELVALPFSCGEEFETYHNNELYYFYPEKDPVQAVRWALIGDILRERRVQSEKQD